MTSLVPCASLVAVGSSVRNEGRPWSSCHHPSVKRPWIDRVRERHLWWLEAVRGLRECYRLISMSCCLERGGGGGVALNSYLNLYICLRKENVMWWSKLSWNSPVLIIANNSVKFPLYFIILNSTKMPKSLEPEVQFFGCFQQNVALKIRIFLVQNHFAWSHHKYCPSL